MLKPLFFRRQADITLFEVLHKHPGGKWRVEWLTRPDARAGAVYELRGKTADVYLETSELPHFITLSRRLFSVWLLGKLRAGAVITKQS